MNCCFNSFPIVCYLSKVLSARGNPVSETQRPPGGQLQGQGGVAPRVRDRVRARVRVRVRVRVRNRVN